MVTMATVVVTEAALPHADSIGAYIKSTWPSASSFGAVEVQDDTVFFKNGDAVYAFVMLIPLPIQWEEIEYACDSAMNWPDAGAELRKGSAHLICTILGDHGNAVERHLRTTMLVQAVSHLTNAVGIYWGSAESVWKPSVFAAYAQSMAVDESCYVLWFGLKSYIHEDETVSAFSIGLEQFDLMNVEIQGTKRSSLLAFELVGDVSLYLIKNGPVIKDGNTVDSSEGDRVKVSIAKSLHNPANDVLRLFL